MSGSILMGICAILLTLRDSSVATAQAGLREVDGQSATATRGVVVFGFDRIDMTVKGPGGIQRVEGASGKLQLPAGDYQIMWASAEMEDPRGGRWMLSIGFTRENSSFRIAAGQPARLRCGGPLQFSLLKRQDYGNVIAVMYDATQADDVPDPDPRAIAFDLNLKDAFGNNPVLFRTPTGKLPPHATLSISDGSGRRVANCQFKYG